MNGINRSSPSKEMWGPAISSLLVPHPFPFHCSYRHFGGSSTIDSLDALSSAHGIGATVVRGERAVVVPWVQALKSAEASNTEWEPNHL